MSKKLFIAVIFIALLLVSPGAVVAQELNSSNNFQTNAQLASLISVLEQQVRELTLKISVFLQSRTALAQVATLDLYTDSIVSPWYSAHYGGAYDNANIEQVYTGTNAIKASANVWGAVSIAANSPYVSVSGYENFEFAIFSTSSFTTGGVNFQTATSGTFKAPNQNVVADQWTTISIPLTSFASSTYNLGGGSFLLYRLNIQNNGTPHVFWVDSVRFTAAGGSGPPPSGGGGADTAAPNISITAPVGGATVSSTISLLASASDDVGVAGVQLKLDGTNLGAEVTSAPYSVSWDTTSASNSSHVLTAVARDAAGNQTTSASVTVTVSNPDITLPSVSITVPIAGATVLGSSVTVSASASDNIGVVGVQFRLDGSNLGAEDVIAPYATTWDTTSASNGFHTLTAIARDAAGNSATSPSVPALVSNGGGVATSSTPMIVYDDAYISPWTNASYGGTYDSANTEQVYIGTYSIKASSSAWGVVSQQTWNNPQGVSSYSNFEFSVYTTSSFPVVVSFQAINPGSTTTISYSISTPYPTAVANQWTTISIPLSSFTNSGAPLSMSGAAVNRANIQNNGTGRVFWVDNIRFVVADGGSGDTVPPSVSITAPTPGSTVSGASTVISASASDNIGVIGVQFKLDGVNLGSEDTTAPYSVSWDTTTASNGSHALAATARDAAGNNVTAAAVTVTVANTFFVSTRKVMPLGDSITLGNWQGGYRAQLYNLLANGGYGNNFVFAGRNTANGNDANLGFVWPSTHKNHEGYGSATIDNAGSTYIWNQNIGNALAANPPDIILLMLGTNDVFSTVRTASQIRANMSSFLDQIWTVNQNIKIVLSNIPYETANAALLTIIQQTNALWPGLVSEKQQLGRYITLVDNYSALTLPSDFEDGVHPSVTGYLKMANAWYPAVVSAIATDTQAPSVSLSSPSDNSTVSGIITVSASVSDNVGITGVQFKLDGNNLDAEDIVSPYSVSWSTAGTPNGSHVITAIARDAAGNQAASNAATVIVSNASTATTTLWISAYLPSWELRVPGTAVNWGSYTAAEIDWDAFTHLIFFATGLTDTNGGCCTVQPDNYNWNATRLNDIVTAAHNHGKPVLFSVGGAGGSSATWATVLGNTTPRQNFINNLVSFMDTWRFDGIDIDIEPLDATVTPYLPVFSQELRATLQAKQAYYDSSKKPILTTAIYNFPTSWAGVASYYDQLNIMSYDLFGSWWGEMWHNNAPQNVKNPDGTCNIVDIAEGNGNTCMNTVESKVNQFALSSPATPLNKLGGGVSFGAYLWKGGLNQAGTNGMLNPRERWQTAPVQWRVLNGTILQGGVETAYWDLKRTLFPQLPPEAFKRDSLSNVPYISWDKVGTTEDLYVTYEDASSTIAVVNKIKNMNLGGMILWHIGSGYLGTNYFPSVVGPRDELLQAVKSSAFTTISTSTPAPDTSPPSVSITSPLNGVTVSSMVVVSANVSDNVGVAGVQFKLDGVNIGSELTAGPYSISWNTITSVNGLHSLIAIVRDAAGNQTISGAVNVTVNNFTDTSPPSVSITSPLNGVTVSSMVVVSANVSDNVGVAGVQFRLNGLNLGPEDTAAPYGVNWDTTSVSNGSYTVSAVARDGAGNTSISSNVSVVVANQSPTPILSVSPLNFAFSAAQGGSAPVAESLTISNTGASGMNWNIQTGASWLTANPSAGIDNRTVAISVSPAGLNVGIATSTLMVSAMGATGSPATIPVTFQITVVPDTVPPAIGNVQTSSTTAIATAILWATSEPSDSQVEYGTTVGYGLTTSLDSNLTMNHAVSLANLTRNTIYHYRVVSADAAGNKARSVDQVFTTPARLPKPPNVTNVSAAAGSVILTWTNPIYEYFSRVVVLKTTDSYLQNPQVEYQIAETPSNRFVDTNISQGTTYYYTLFTTDDMGSYSDPEHISFGFHAVGATGGGGGGGGGASFNAPAMATLTIYDSTSTVSLLNQGEFALPVRDARNFIFTQPLVRGMQGDSVRQLQLFLSQDKALYPQGTVNGVFGPATERAVKNFQCRFNLVCEGTAQTSGWGKLNEKTIAKLNELLARGTFAGAPSSSPSPSTKSVMSGGNLSRGSQGNEVRALQEFLAKDKETYPQGIVNGTYGPATERAVKKFQCKNNIICAGSRGTTGWGAVGPRTRVKLNELMVK
ncbi:MAG: Ig-like domain-containing protein [Candidatus Brennerbacteria bacterium]